jgi:hypothetical protein
MAATTLSPATKGTFIYELQQNSDFTRVIHVISRDEKKICVKLKIGDSYFFLATSDVCFGNSKYPLL